MLQAMEPEQWFATFRALHDQARKGLDPNGADRYRTMKDELARSLLAMEGKKPEAGTPARRQISVPTVHQLEVGGTQRGTTRELSCQGFTALVTSKVKEGEVLGFVLTLTRTAEPVRGDCIVRACLKQANGTVRLTCTFTKMEEELLERIELALFDVALTRFRI